MNRYKSKEIALESVRRYRIVTNGVSFCVQRRRRFLFFWEHWIESSMCYPTLEAARDEMQRLEKYLDGWVPVK